MWEPDFDNLFRCHYRKLETHLQKRVDNAIREILDADDPAKLGRQKRGRLRHFYGYDLGTQYRIIYHVSYNTRRVIFVDVGSHKQVYRRR